MQFATSLTQNYGGGYRSKTLIMHDSQDGKTTALVVTDIPLLRYGIVAVLHSTQWLKVVGQTADAPEAKQICVAQRPELAVVDLDIETGDGLSLIKDLRHLKSGIGVLVLSHRKDALWVQRAFRSGANGFLSKTDMANDLSNGLWQIYNGQRYIGHTVLQVFVSNFTECVSWKNSMDKLSDRELTILRCVAENQGPKKIAQRLKIAVTTVETHLSRIKSKLGVRDGEELKRTAARWIILAD